MVSGITIVNLSIILLFAVITLIYFAIPKYWSWDAWSPCTTTGAEICGVKGTQKRTRQCRRGWWGCDPKKKYLCLRPKEQSRKCDMEPCATI